MNGALIGTRLERASLRLGALVIFAGLLLATAGVFDTEAVRFGPRLAYWISIVAFSTAALEGAHVLLRRLAPAVDQALVRLIGWTVLVLPLNTIAVLTCKLLFGGWPSIGGFLYLLPGMAAIVAALQLVLWSFRGPAAAHPAPAAPVPPPAASELAERLPLPLRSAVIEALQAEDHYVRIHTSAGAALVRMRFQDAVALLASVEGCRPHRSWWVAHDAIATMQRQGNRTVIVMRSGQRVPVSRSARPLLGPLFDVSSEG